MKLTLAFLVLLSSAVVANAGCYADYKAKQDSPLRLHYGVAEISGNCSVRNAEQQLKERLADKGWQLLNVLGVFDESGLEERKANAGRNFLRY